MRSSGAKHTAGAAIERVPIDLRGCDISRRRETVRNSYPPEREILTAIGALPVEVPKVRDRSGQGHVFRSELVLRYVRKAASVEAVLPWLCSSAVAGRPIGCRGDRGRLPQIDPALW